MNGEMNCEIMERFLNGELAGKKLTRDEAADLILYDVKRDLVNTEAKERLIRGTLKMDSQEQVNEEVVGEFLKKKGLKPEQWDAVCFREELSDTKNNIKNFLSYRILVELGLWIDCDKSEKAAKALKMIYGVEQFEGYGNLGRYYTRDGYVFESDTMNSFMTMFGMYIGGKVSGFRKMKKREGLLYLLMNFDEIWERIGTEGDEEQRRMDLEIKQELELLSRLTHSVFNFGLVSCGFNIYRGLSWKYRDFWILSFDGSLGPEKVEDLAEEIYQSQRPRKIRELEEIRESLVGYRQVLDKKVDDVDKYLFYEGDECGEFVRSVNEVKMRKVYVNDEDFAKVFLNVLKNMTLCIMWRGTMVIEKETGEQVDWGEGFLGQFLG